MRVSGGRRRALGFPSREAEAVIRGALGELAFLDHVHPGEVSYAEIGIAVLGRLFAEWQPGPGAVDALFGVADDVLAEAQGLEPGMAVAEDRWFAAGMDVSPFAVAAGEVPAAREGRGGWRRARRRSLGMVRGRM